jgi:CelD/BcsL family acetyltransferase involved in cellulose biosynthesis
METSLASEADPKGNRGRDDGAMIVRVVEARSLTPHHIVQWSRIQRSDITLATPFFCPEFTRIVASVRDDVHVGVLHDNETIVGFFPFQRGRWGSGRPVGWRMSDYQGAVVEPGLSWRAKELIRDCGLKTWEFDHLIASQRAFEPFHRSRQESPVMELSNGLEAYVGGLRRSGGGRTIANVARQMRRLERDHGTLRFAVHVAEPEVLGTLLHWKREQYRRTGGADILAHDWTRGVVELVHATQTPTFAGVLSALYAGDRIAGLHMGLRSSSIWHSWFPAYDLDLATYSPGLILLLKMAESAQSLGIRTIDLGKGEAEYKRRFMSGSVALAEGRVELPSLAAATLRFRHAMRPLARRASLGAPARRIARRGLRKR